VASGVQSFHATDQPARTADFSTNYRLSTSDSQAAEGQDDDPVRLPNLSFSMMLKTFRNPT
jgi:hypothetical protein